MPLAIALVLLVIGTILFHFLSPWWFTPIASNWGMIDDTVIITFWVTGIVFAAVNLFMAYAVIRYRHRQGRKAAYEPENKKLEGWLTGLTSIGIAAMLAPGLFVWAKFVKVPEDAAVFEVVGQQWHWSFRFPGEDGVLGTVDARYISAENPFGMNPQDPDGQDDRLVASNVVHLPIDKPVKALLRSKDVLHDFAVPQFRVKMDLVPGLVSYLWFIPTRAGIFEILCEELCGVGHHTMRGRVVVEEESAFQDWLSNQPTFAQFAVQATGDATAGRALYAACSACHGLQGEGNQTLNAPKLSGQQEWYLIRQLKNFKQGIRGTHEKDIYGQQMAAMTAMLVNDAAIKDVAAYIATLPDEPAMATVRADAANGRGLYVTCGACHGVHGEGNQALNAPKLSGQLDWYLIRQLKHFKQGIRGSDSKDLYGPQMASMAAILADDQAINDVVAYLNTLP